MDNKEPLKFMSWMDPQAGLIDPLSTSEEPFYNNILALSCEREYALEKDFTFKEYVDRHIKNWNFSKKFDWLKTQRFQHEFFHGVLGLIFLKERKNILPFDYGYDGNNQAEAVVIAIEDLLFKNLGRFQSSRQTSHRYFSKKIRHYDHHEPYVAEQFTQAAHHASQSDEIVSIFEVRRRHQFERIHGMKTSTQTKWGETIPKAKSNIPQSSIDDIFEHIYPVISLLRELAIEKGVFDLARSRSDRLGTIGHVLKELHFRDIWDFMNDSNSITAHTLRMDEANIIRNIDEEGLERTRFNDLKIMLRIGGENLADSIVAQGMSLKELGKKSKAIPYLSTHFQWIKIENKLSSYTEYKQLGHELMNVFLTQSPDSFRMEMKRLSKLDENQLIDYINATTSKKPHAGGSTPSP